MIMNNNWIDKFSSEFPTVFLLKIRHLLFFGTLSLKCVLNLQILASALVLRHSKPTARREKSFTSWKRAVDAFSFKTRARRHTSNYSALMELLPQLLPNIGQANLKLFILRRIFRRNTVLSYLKNQNTAISVYPIPPMQPYVYVEYNVCKLPSSQVLHLNSCILVTFSP